MKIESLSSFLQSFSETVKQTFWKGFCFFVIRGPVKKQIEGRLKRALEESKKRTPKKAIVQKGTDLLSRDFIVLNSSQKITHLANRLERYTQDHLKLKKNISSFKSWSAHHEGKIFLQHPRFVDIVLANHLLNKMELFDHKITSKGTVLLEGRQVPIQEVLKRVKVDKEGKFQVQVFKKQLGKSKQTTVVKKGWNYTSDKGFTRETLSPKKWTPLMVLSPEKVREKFGFDAQNESYGAQLVSIAKGKDQHAIPGWVIDYGHVWIRLFKKREDNQVEVYSLGFYVGDDFQQHQPFKLFSGIVQQDDRYEFLPKNVFNPLANSYVFSKKAFEKAYTLGQAYLSCGLHYHAFEQNCLTLPEAIMKEVEEVEGKPLPRPKGLINPKETSPSLLKKIIDFIPEALIAIPRYLFKTCFNFSFVLLGISRPLKLRNEDHRTQKDTKFFKITPPIPMPSLKLLTYNVMKRSIPRFWRVEQIRKD